MIFQETAVTASWLRNGTHESLSDHDYRAYLISRSPPPTVHHSYGVLLRRWQVRAGRAVNVVDRMLHRMIEALARSKTRRIRRELLLRGIRYTQLTDDESSSRR